MSELVIGLVAGGKHWDYVEAWVLSLRASGYEGDAALVTVNCEPDLHEQSHRHDVRTFKAGKEEFMTRHRQNFPAGRFLPLGQAIADAYPDHFALATDVRDVFFQRNPFDWFAERHPGDSYLGRLFATSEEVAHDDGTIAGNWNAARIEQLFGARMREGAQGTPVYNAGVMCGHASLLSGLLRTIWLMCFNFRGAGGDQAAYNLLLQMEPYRSLAMPLRLEDAWAVHFGGISRGAVPEDRLPRYEDGLVKNAQGQVFPILHQYNRVPEALDLVRSRLGDVSAKG
jgi:hypothetical protein